MAKKTTATKKTVATQATGSKQEQCAAALEKLDEAKYPTKSAKIRELNAQGFSRGEIAKSMGILYQHVRNVLITPLKRDTE